MSASNWTTTNMPDMSGKRVVITGATSGLGRAEAEAIAAKGADIVIGVRDTKRGEAVANELRKSATGGTIEVRHLDQANLASIEAFAGGLLADVDRIDLLLNNAGVMVPPLGHTVDGFELQMGTNHFGTYALTMRLMPLLRASDNGRVTVTSSVAHRQGKPDLSDLDWKTRRYSAWQAYGDSKIANLLFAYELDRRLGGTGPKVVAGHPGWTRTDLQRHSGVAKFLNPFMGMPLEQGVLSPLRAATDPTAKSGEFYGPDGRREMRGYPVRVEPIALAKDADLAAGLWEISAERTGLDL